MTARRIAVVLAGGIAIGLGVASTAWACFVAGTAPYLSAPLEAPAGASVTVTGANWVAGAEPVAVRWGSESGTLLTYGHPKPDARGAFSVVITVPRESTGPQMIYAVQPGSETQAAALDVTRPASADPVDPIDPQPTRTGVATSGGAARPPAPAPAATTPASASVISPAVADTASLFPSAPAQPQAPSATAAGPSRTAGRVAATRPGSALRSPLPSAAASPAAADVEESQPAAAPSPRSASGDVWSGLTSGLDRTDVPSLANLPTTTGSSTSETVVGLGLLVAGMVALSAGFAAAELRRRQALAGSSRTAA